jgi:hypothetical protein
MKRFGKNIPIQAQLLMKYNMTLKDLKAEAILVLVKVLVDEALRMIDGKVEPKGNIDSFDNEDVSFVNKATRELHSYLEDKLLIDFESICDILDRASNKPLNSPEFLNAKMLEPLAFYYDTIAKVLTKNHPKGTQWMPDLLAFVLLVEAKNEAEIYFAKHDFIREYDFLQVTEKIYKAYLVSKKKEETFEIDLMDKTMDTSKEMIKKLLVAKYGVVTTRKSGKKRGKK